MSGHLSYGMGRLLTNDYNRQWRESQSPNHFRSPNSAKRIQNPLISTPRSARHRYLDDNNNQVSQHKYNLEQQQSHHHSYNNDLNLFQTHNKSPDIIRQRQLLQQQRREQSQQYQSPNSKYSNPLRSPLKSPPIKSPFTSPIKSPMQSPNTNKPAPLNLDKFRSPPQNDRTYTNYQNQNQPPISQRSTRSNWSDSVHTADVPEYFVNPLANRVSYAAERYRQRLARDKWGKVQSLHDNLERDCLNQHQNVQKAKQNELRQELMNQMKVNEDHKRMEQQRKQRELAEMKKLTEMQKQMDLEDRKKKLESQARLRGELEKFAAIQSKANQVRKQKELNDEKYYIEQAMRREQETERKRYQKALKEKEVWTDMVAKNAIFKKEKEIAAQKQRERDIETMKLYSDILEKEEVKRKQFLKDIQREMGQKAEINYKILEEKQRKLLQEEERLLRYQQLRDDELLKQDINRVTERKRKGNEYQSYLRQQMEEKQRAKQAEIERMRKERIELEQHIKDAEQQRLDELYARKKSKSEYAAELRRQQRDDLEHRFQNEFAMGNKEREYHRQYLEPTQRMNQDLVGAFPRESPSRRDRRYLQ